MSRDLAARIAEADDDRRRRAARDLHDGPQQQLVTAVIDLQLAGRAWDDDPQRARGLVDDALAQVQEGLAGLRALAAELHPAVLTTRGVGAAIEALADGLDVRVELSDHLGDDRLPPALETSLYLVAAEALRAATGDGTVELSADGATVVMDLGLPGASVGATGADRLAVVGGSFAARAGGGVRVEAPLRRCSGPADRSVRAGPSARTPPPRTPPPPHAGRSSRRRT